MTQARMNELKDALESVGWKVSARSESSGLFEVEEERILWKLSMTKVFDDILLTFYLFDDLGRQTKRLADILYVEEEGKGTRLYFEKIGTQKWQSALREFVHNLY